LAVFTITSFATFAGLLLAAQKLAHDPNPLNRVKALADLASNGKSLAAALRDTGLTPLAQEMARRAEEAAQAFTHDGPARDDAKLIFEQVAPEAFGDLAAFAAGEGTVTQILDDTRVRISRVVRGGVEAVWRAHHDAGLLQQWLLGPDGWTMPVCEVATDVGQSYRYEWSQVDGDGRFGFTGTLVESIPPHRAVMTEEMIGMESPSTLNEMTLTAIDGGVLLSIVITYPDAEVRDTVLGTGMTDGMERSYQRLEALIA